MMLPRPNGSIPRTTVEQLVEIIWTEATSRPIVVLAIADEALRTECRRRLLRSLFTVVEPPFGELPSESSGAFPPDVLLVDVRSPEDNGWGVVRKLRDDPRTHDVPVVALVVQPEGADLWWARRLRVARLLPVPWEGDELLTAIEGVMLG